MIINKTYYSFDIRTKAKIEKGELIPISLKRIIMKDRDGEETIISQTIEQPKGKICYVRIYPFYPNTNIARTYSLVELYDFDITKEQILQTEALNNDNNIIIFLDDFQIHNLKWDRKSVV